MKNSKGITVASLVIIIASIILLSTMAITFGYRYLTETKNADEKYFTEVLSSAVTKRENNYIVNPLEYPRVGYYVSTLEAFQNIINKYVPEVKNSSEAFFDSGLWYIIDTKAADKLGVKGSDEYIDVFDVNSYEKANFALVDYFSGTVFMIKIDKVSDIIGIGGDVSVIPDDGHTHSFNIERATCTLEKKCLICGYVEEAILGHDYGSGSVPCAPIDDEFHYTKECTRCGMKGGYERHVAPDDGTGICVKCGGTIAGS